MLQQAVLLERDFIEPMGPYLQDFTFVDTVLALALMAFVEVVVSGYVQVLPTPAFCVLVASAALGVSAHRYFATWRRPSCTKSMS